MAKEVRLPRLGKEMEDGTIVAFCVKIGDLVNESDNLFEVETDKATVDVESPASGVVKNFLIDVGQTVTVGSPVLVLGSADEEIPAAFISSLKSQIKLCDESDKTIYDDHEYDLKHEEISEITESFDPEKFEKVPLTKMQKIISEKMIRSKREIPCFYLNINIDVTGLQQLRTEYNQANEEKLSLNDFIVRAAALSIKHYPIMTGQLAGDSIKISDSINIGLAIAVDDGLVALTIKDAGNLTIQQIALSSKQLIEKAKKGTYSFDDLQDANITLSNLGSFGVDMFIPIVIPGQCSILGVGKIKKTCVSISGEIAVRDIMSLTLSVDHKIVNGAEAAQFLDYIKKILENPDSMM